MHAWEKPMNKWLNEWEIKKKHIYKVYYYEWRECAFFP